MPFLVDSNIFVTAAGLGRNVIPTIAEQKTALGIIMTACTSGILITTLQASEISNLARKFTENKPAQDPKCVFLRKTSEIFTGIDKPFKLTREQEDALDIQYIKDIEKIIKFKDDQYLKSNSDFNNHRSFMGRSNYNIKDKFEKNFTPGGIIAASFKNDWLFYRMAGLTKSQIVTGDGDLQTVHDAIMDPACPRVWKMKELEGNFSSKGAMDATLAHMEKIKPLASYGLGMMGVVPSEKPSDADIKRVSDRLASNLRESGSSIAPAVISNTPLTRS